MSATNIENCLIRAGHDRRIILQFHPRSEHLGTHSAGMLVLDNDFTIHAVNRRGAMVLTGVTSILGVPFDQIFDSSFETVSGRLAQGESLRVRDRFGSAVSMRCVANRASFALAGRHAPAAAATTQGAAAANAFGELVIDDLGLRRALLGLPDAARQGRPICLIGETGSGKEVFARLAHAVARHGGPFVVVDGATLAAGDAVATLFGHGTSAGLLAEASGGSLFVADLMTLPLAAQAALAEVIDAGAYRHPATGVLTPTDILFLCASSAPLDAAGLVPQLRYQLADCCIALPALGKPSDLWALALRIAKAARADADLAPGLIARLSAHDWRGNLHAMRSVLNQTAQRRTRGPATDADLANLLPRPKDGALALPCPSCTGVPWKEIQCREIQQAVCRRDGNISRASRDLGMSRTTVYKHFS